MGPGFRRLTDEAWAELVTTSALPERPDWVNIYLADAPGAALPAGRELASAVFDPGARVLDPTPPDPVGPGPEVQRWASAATRRTHSAGLR